MLIRGAGGRTRVKGLLGAPFSCCDTTGSLSLPFLAMIGEPVLYIPQFSCLFTGWPSTICPQRPPLIPSLARLDSSASPPPSPTVPSATPCLPLSSLDKTAEPTTRYPVPRAPQGPQLTQAAGAEAVVGPRLGLGLVAVKDLLHQLLH